MNVDDFLKHEFNRRQFLGTSAQNAAGMAAGMVGFSGAVAKAVPNERVSVAAIGVRNQGKRLAEKLAELDDVDVTAICDCDSSVLGPAASAMESIQGTAPRFEKDFRRILDDGSIDAVVIATPDHWHAIMAIMACQAGKDVYVEKPVSHNVLEGVHMVRAAHKFGRVVQTGLQQRSGTHFQSAVEFVRSGKLGPVRLAKAWTVHRRKPIGFKKSSPAPKTVDYDMWLGPAGKRRFNANRFHHNWHWFWEYGSGELGNWGVHMLDIARWGLDVGLPSRISATGGKYTFNDDQETPDTQVVQYSYPDKTIVWEHRLWSTHGIEGRSAAAAFYGELGTLIVDRGGWKVYDAAESVTSGPSEQVATHLRNFVDCIKTRQSPTSDIEIGHISSALCHLGNVAFRLGRDVEFDPATISVNDDKQAAALMGREYRKPWQLPDV